MAGHMDPTGNPYLEAQINNMKTSAADNMNIFGMGDNRSEANMSGQFGSSRHGIDDYLTRKDAMNTANVNEINMRNAAYEGDMNRSVNAAGNYVGSGMDASGQIVDQNQAAIESMGNVHNLGLNPYQAAWLPMQNQADIIGGPTVLTKSKSSGSGSGFSASVAASK